jgi:signal transduction histidine kinase
MLARAMRHKQNGHRTLPSTGGLDPGEIARLVHAEVRPSPVTEDLLRFLQVVRSEDLASLHAQVRSETDALRTGLGEAIAVTRAAFSRGELPDVRAALERFQAQVNLIERFLSRLVAATRLRLGARRVVSLNDLVRETLGGVRLVPRGSVSITTRLCPELPPIAADPAQIKDMLTLLLDRADTSTGAGAACRLTVETSCREGVVRGEGVVRLQVLEEVAAPAVDPGPVAEALAGRLAVAARVAREHGGVLSVEILPGQGRCITVEFPAV